MISQCLQRLVSTLLTVFISIYTSSVIKMTFGAFRTGSQTELHYLPSMANMFAQVYNLWVLTLKCISTATVLYRSQCSI